MGPNLSSRNYFARVIENEGRVLPVAFTTVITVRGVRTGARSVGPPGHGQAKKSGCSILGRLQAQNFFLSKLLLKTDQTKGRTETGLGCLVRPSVRSPVTGTVGNASQYHAH